MGPRVESPIRFGVLGCGDIAWRRTVPAMLRAGVPVAAFASRELRKAQRFAERFGGDPIEGYARLLDRADVDAVYLALPTGLHHAWALRALEAGKHVLVEKPLTRTLPEAEELVAAACKAGRWMAENFTFLRHSQHATVTSLIAQGLIGEPLLFTSDFGIPPLPARDIRYQNELGGGALLDVGVYPVRAARLHLGSDLTVQGAVLRWDRRRGVDLGGTALLSRADGVAAQVSFSFESSYRSTYSVWGSEGRITLDRAFTPPETLRPTLRIERQNVVEERSLPADDQFANVIRHFVRCAADRFDFEPQATALLRQAATVAHIVDSALRVDV